MSRKRIKHPKSASFDSYLLKKRRRKLPISSPNYISKNTNNQKKFENSGQKPPKPKPKPKPEPAQHIKIRRHNKNPTNRPKHREHKQPKPPKPDPKPKPKPEKKKENPWKKIPKHKPEPKKPKTHKYIDSNEYYEDIIKSNGEKTKKQIINPEWIKENPYDWSEENKTKEEPSIWKKAWWTISPWLPHIGGGVMH